MEYKQLIQFLKGIWFQREEAVSYLLKFILSMPTIVAEFCHLQKGPDRWIT